MAAPKRTGRPASKHARERAKQRVARARAMQEGRLRPASAKEAELLRRRLGYRLRADGTLEKISPLKTKRDSGRADEVADAREYRSLVAEQHAALAACAQTGEAEWALIAPVLADSANGLRPPTREDVLTLIQGGFIDG
jgi:hypothetical protein